MIDQIATGDLVVVVEPSPCCGNLSSIGLVFKVQGVNSEPSRCIFCGFVSSYRVAVKESGIVCKISRLKKIPPLSELETIEIKEEIPA